MTYPDHYFLFIGGAADKEPFVWQNIKLPFKHRFIHRSMGRLANYFLEKLQENGFDSTQLSRIKIDYLGYHEIYFDEWDSNLIKSTSVSKLNSTRYQSITHHIGPHTKVYIIGHSLGGWNAAHLSSILTQQNIQVEYLVTLDPVGTGNHELSAIAPLIKKAQIYQKEPIPCAKNWINIQAHHIHLRHKIGSKLIEDWVAWMGGQWLITKHYSTVKSQLNELTEYSHKQVFKMFLHQTKLDKLTCELLLNAIKR